ncbi:lantibiotic biosynthesis protein [Marmoricola endophyticus]|uniref:Lantibiotic biosynthesis protein n=1 Tax=Marmoricola endophyticus TaxID=2040280 RepID=A0A917F749_9ACTN|nr:thiopeptide-type bacteriocin biosynthesis protein [Marmoricola endophyticus]GGF53952.1 lantibiotic biosynthesis protein [Marmoricola endophyticus]
MSSTSPEQAERWHAFHVYLPHTVQSAFLREQVTELVDTAESARFFFLRYWQGGPHLRLRLHTDEATADVFARALGDRIPELTEEQRVEYGYELDMQKQLASAEGESPGAGRSPGDVVRESYAPEYAKYGGPEGIDLAEQVFCATSRVVLDVLASRETYARTPPLGEAMRCTLVGLSASGLGQAEAGRFLEWYESWWSGYVPDGQAESWQRLSAQMRGQVDELVDEAWDGTRDDVVRDLYRAARARADELDTGDGDVPVVGGVDYSRILANYVHTTNNRFGIIPAGEAFLARVLSEALHARVG